MTTQPHRTRRYFHPQSLTNLMRRRRGRGIVAFSLFCLVLLTSAAFIGASHAGRGYGQNPDVQDGIEPQGGILPDVFVANRNSNRVVRINPNTGTQTLLTNGGSFNSPTGLDIGPDGFLYVTSFANNNIVRVDPTAGTQTVITTGGLISSPVGIIYAADGNIYVASSGNNSIVRINAATNSLTTFASGGALSGIQFLAFAPDGFLYVASATNNSIVRINAITGAQNTLTSGNLLGGVTGITFGADGNIYTTNITNNSIVRVNPNDGAQTLVSPTGGGTNQLSNPRGLTFGVDGNLLVGNNSGAGNILRVDPNTGAQTVVTSGGQLNNVWGITRVEQTGNRGCTPPPTGLVAWYTGDGSAGDIIGGNDGTLQNGATFAQGKVAQAFSLDGIDDYVQAPASARLPVGNSPRTVDLWFRTPSNFSASTNLAFVQYGTPTDNNMFGLITSFNAPGKLYFFGFNNDLAGTTTLQPDTFYHAAVTYDGSTLNLYLNGQLEATKNTTALNTIIDQNGLTIGFRPDFPLFGAGLIDEVEIFNRALSQTEIQSIFNADAAGKCGKVPSPSNAATSVMWINAGGGMWNNPANWRDGTGVNRVPTVADQAFINLAGTYAVNLDVDATVANFVFGATSGTQTFNMNGRTLTISEGSSVRPNAIFNLNGGMLAGTGDIIIAGILNWSGGNMTGAGATNIAAGATLAINSPSNNVGLIRTINNSGTTNLVATNTNGLFIGGGVFGISGGGTFNNLSGSLFDIQADVGISNAGGGTTLFTNAGTFRKSAGTGTSTISVPFNNNGVVEALTGRLNFTGGFNQTSGTPPVFSGTIITRPPGSLDPLVTAVRVNNQLVITPRANVPGESFNAFATVSAINLTNASVSAEIVRAAAGGAETAFAVANNADNFLRFLITTPEASPSASTDAVGGLGTPAPQLIFQIRTSSGGMRELKRITYDPVRHRFLRFRADTTATAQAPRGFISFDTSACPATGSCSPSNPDLLPWVEEVRNNIEERSVQVNALSAELSAGTSRAVAQPGQAIFDNFQLVRKGIKGRRPLRGRGRSPSASSTFEAPDRKRINGDTKPDTDDNGQDPERESILYRP
ncbi:MAG: hypothetical protein MSG64_17310 [Pyrinomonadaceae bacterium MAG19_C2-C3]|nr:hypothetical protein [Pyrinomonadaceae bacterium MAG19_C2-C3]